MITISELMIRLQNKGYKSTGFFFNIGLNEWQFTVCDHNRNYSYGYGYTPEEAALEALTNIEKGKLCTEMKVARTKAVKPSENIDDFL